MDRDEHIFAYVMDELEDGIKNEALWIKSFSVAEGNENKHKALYLQYRVEEIKSVFKKNNIDYTECSKDKISKYIENGFKDELSPEWMRKLWQWADKHSIPDLDNLNYCSGLARTMNRLIKQDILRLSDENKTIGELPKEIGNLINLEKIEVSNTNISSVPKEIGKLINLNELGLDFNKVTKLPKEVENLKKVKKLSLGFTSELPKGLRNFKSITELSIHKAAKIDSKEIEGLVNLKKLYISGSSHLEMIPKEIGNLNKLEELTISWCDNLIEIPKEIGKLSNLEELNLGKNKKLKTLPKELGNLTKLKNLDFCCHVGSGYMECTILKSFPEELSNLTNLRFINIDLSNEKDIPNGLFNLSALTITGWVECFTEIIKKRD